MDVHVSDIALAEHDQVPERPQVRLQRRRPPPGVVTVMSSGWVEPVRGVTLVRHLEVAAVTACRAGAGSATGR